MSELYIQYVAYSSRQVNNMSNQFNVIIVNKSGTVVYTTRAAPPRLRSIVMYIQLDNQIVYTLLRCSIASAIFHIYMLCECICNVAVRYSCICNLNVVMQRNCCIYSPFTLCIDYTCTLIHSTMFHMHTHHHVLIAS